MGAFGMLLAGSDQACSSSAGQLVRAPGSTLQNPTLVDRAWREQIVLLRHSVFGWRVGAFALLRVRT